MINWINKGKQENIILKVIISGIIIGVIVSVIIIKFLNL
jgi:hypothetical protein